MFAMIMWRVQEGEDFNQHPLLILRKLRTLWAIDQALLRIQIIIGNMAVAATCDENYDFEMDGHKIDDYFCPICYLLLQDTAQLPCNHLMCRKCLDQWTVG